MENKRAKQFMPFAALKDFYEEDEEGIKSHPRLNIELNQFPSDRKKKKIEIFDDEE